MQGFYGVLLVAVLGGVAVTLQAQLMAILDRGIGTLESVFITYGGGGLLIGLVMLAMRGGNLGAWTTLPVYTLTSGVLGLVIVASIGFSAPRLGLVVALTVVVAAQFLTGALIEHYGWFGATAHPIEPGRILGIGCLLTGTWLLVR